MSSVEEDEEGPLYQVPPPPRTSLGNIFSPHPVSEDVGPPTLMPKKGSSFKRASSLLDRQTPVVTPKPRPRLPSHKRGSADSAMSNSEENHEGDADQKTANSSNNMTAKNDPVISSSNSQPTKSEKQENEDFSDRPSFSPSENQSVGEISTPSPAPRPVPKPRPRTKFPASLTNSSTNLTNVSHSSSSSPHQVQEESNLRQSQSMDKFAPASESALAPRPVSVIRSLPPDADSVETMLNDEVDKKYGLTSPNEDAASVEKAETPSLNTTASSSTQDDNNTEDTSLNSDNDGEDDGLLYVNTDNIKSSNENSHPPRAPPKPHVESNAPSYLPMTKKTSTGSVTSGVAFEPSSALSGVLSPVLPDVEKFDLGTELLSESSTDSVPEFPENDVSTSFVPTTPKPFDIQPFRSNIPFSSDPPNEDNLYQTAAQLFDISDFDPLLADRPKLLAATSSQNDLGKHNDSSLSQTSSSFTPDWNNAFSDAVCDSSDPFSSNSYVTAEEPDEQTEAYYSQPGEPETVNEPKPQNPVLSHMSFHFAAPTAPPPPFPREQNRIPEPRPPPVPPRPSPALTPETKNVPGQSVNKDVFEALPTPLFTPTEDKDPFQDSSFDFVCHKFNQNQAPSPAAQVPTPQPRAPIPKKDIPQPKEQGAVAAVEASADVDPERISRFVIPPPNSQGNDPGAEYLLAKELSDSDSESFDSALESMYSWPENGAPFPNEIPTSSGEALSPKKNTRDGYLLKQGGYKANKGWKRRWVVFDGTNLSYYTNNVSQVSKRIIPVRCIADVETDVKPNDKNGFRFKVVTTLKDRVFLFSAETLDNCLTWASTLMAAVTEYKKSTNADEDTLPKPDKEGFIKFGNMKKFYVTITGKTLCYYQSLEDFEMGSPIHEIDMKLGSVKVKDHKKLQLWIHYGHFDLTFDSDQEMQNWRMAMEDAIAEGLADDTVLAKVYENMSNQQCADCLALDPHWASINLGIVVCKNCAGVHRMFDYRVSKIRSLRMDTRVWTPSLIELMVAIGNANANAFWEFELPAGAKIQPTESMEKRKEFITKKYIGKKFCNLHPLARQGSLIGEELLKVAAADGILEMMKVLFSGKDVILYRKDGTGSTAYEVAKENGQRLIMELLYQNGGDPQSLTDEALDEVPIQSNGCPNRLREDVRLQGFLNKTGPVGRTFERRWCILEHGALTYYLNERSTTFKGSIERKDMYMIQAVESDRIGYPFEISTGLKENRIFTFSSDCKDDSGEWVRTIAKLMAPVAIMEHVGMIDTKLAGYAFMKESLGDEWHQTFLVFSWRGINYMNRDLKFDYLDLRKASSIKMQDTSSGYQNKGPCFVISKTGRSMYLQATLPRDTEKMYLAFKEAVRESGRTLNDQALTNENVPVIVERCITHVYMNGLEETGIYRTAGQISVVQSLLDEFRKDAWSVVLSEYSATEVANALKRFLRELDDPVFERINYSSWLSVAGCRDDSNRLKWYKYYLEKMPQVNYQTLKRIVLHLAQVARKQDVNKMTVHNLAACFAPSLLRTSTDQPSLNEAQGKEINILVDLINKSDYFFNVDETIESNIRKAADTIQTLMETRRSISEPSAGILTAVHLLSQKGESRNISVTEDMTAAQGMNYLKRVQACPDLHIYILYELLFKGAMERPLFPEDVLSVTTNRWMEWEDWVKEDISFCLCVRGTELLEKLSSNYDPSFVLLSKLQYCEGKPKSKFKKKMIGFRQCKLAVYNDSQGVSEAVSWNVEDITIYLGSMPRKALPSKYCLTFIVNGERYKKSPFGHTLCFDSENELYRWAAALYVAQHPKGLLSWVSE